MNQIEFNYEEYLSILSHSQKFTKRLKNRNLNNYEKNKFYVF